MVSTVPAASRRAIFISLFLAAPAAAFVPGGIFPAPHVRVQQPSVAVSAGRTDPSTGPAAGQTRRNAL
eukprot:CAMPEP_0179246646 /NCGR_PEP_ID=MMETSP0797-20121207/19200_1 /TAXON_ID=47934 /ORGANISM="Dinophysis acuminata, Strain DAEP01" /LENGTH=67 /DNA_ID=CAMNT_0020954239 /DNA_START=21 /DNA_END=220 /DNA_ORIENTATION=-